MRRSQRGAKSSNSASAPNPVMIPVSMLFSGTGIHACLVLFMPFQISSGQDAMRDAAVLLATYTGLLSVITLSGLLAFSITVKSGKAESAAVITASFAASVPYFGIPASLLFTEPLSLPLLAAPFFLGLFGYFLQWISMRLFVVFNIHTTVGVLAVILPVVLICVQVFGAAQS